jgi:hypothetical protein
MKSTAWLMTSSVVNLPEVNLRVKHGLSNIEKCPVVDPQKNDNFGFLSMRTDSFFTP